VKFFDGRGGDEARARELEFHLEVEAADNRARGMDPEAARRKLGISDFGFARRFIT